MFSPSCRKQPPTAVLVRALKQVFVGFRSVKLKATLVRALGRVFLGLRSAKLKVVSVSAGLRSEKLQATLVRALGRVLLWPRSVKLKAVSRVLTGVGKESVSSGDGTNVAASVAEALAASLEAAREERAQRDAEFVARQAELEESAAAQEARRSPAFAEQIANSAAKQTAGLEKPRGSWWWCW